MSKNVQKCPNVTRAPAARRCQFSHLCRTSCRKTRGRIRVKHVTIMTGETCYDDDGSNMLR
eukprot:8274356-Pyramimonas_sp.AAC.2